MAAKNMPARTDTTERPPRIMPRRLSQNSTSSFEIFPFESRSPARIKKGTAVREKELQLSNIRWITIMRFLLPRPVKMVTAAAEQIEKATGTPRISSPRKTIKRIAAIMPSPPYRPGSPGA